METTCPECGQPEQGGKCVNLSCDRAVNQATTAASRTTHKATAGAATAREPNAFTRSGRVD